MGGSERKEGGRVREDLGRVREGRREGGREGGRGREREGKGEREGEGKREGEGGGERLTIIIHYVNNKLLISFQYSHHIRCLIVNSETEILFLFHLIIILNNYYST